MKFGKLLKDLCEGNPQMSEQPLIRCVGVLPQRSSSTQQQRQQQQGHLFCLVPAAAHSSTSSAAHISVQ